MWIMPISDHFVYKALEQMLADDPNARITYGQLQSNLEYPWSTKTVQRCVERLEVTGNIRRLGGGQGYGYRYELILRRD